MPADEPRSLGRPDVDQTGEPGAVVVYWRTGCVFCAALRRGLRRAGVATSERDIWADPDAAAFVRRHARGNETVPTVDIAGTVLVNPTTRQVLAAARAAGIALDDPPPARWRPTTKVMGADQHQPDRADE